MEIVFTKPGMIVLLFHAARPLIPQLLREPYPICKSPAIMSKVNEKRFRFPPSFPSLKMGMEKRNAHVRQQSNRAFPLQHVMKKGLSSIDYQLK